MGRSAWVGRTIWILTTLALIPVPARAQMLWPQPSVEQNAPGFLTSYDFHLNADHIWTNDPRFLWDANIGGDVDLVDYGAGRFNFLANYETVLGNQLQKFDPNQGNYTLDLSSSLRLGHNEVAGVFHHLSRHLGDRPKQTAIALNAIGARIARRGSAGRLLLDSQATVTGVVRRSYVDYAWEANGGVSARYPEGAHVAAIFGANVRLVGVDATIAGRSTLSGGCGEGGVRIAGRKGALELFVAFERRIDPDPLERSVRSWIRAGFRLIDR